MFRQSAAVITVCLACIAAVIGQLWIARHTDGRWERLAAPSFANSSEPGSDAPRSKIDPRAAGRHAPRLLAAGYEDARDPADALQPADRVAEPAERPLTPRQQEEQAAVRAVIEDEMPETSAEERDIWFDELKSLPAEVVRDLLQVRKQLRVLTPDHHLSGPGQLLPSTVPQDTARAPEIAAEPVARSQPVPPGDWSETRQALEQAIAWSTHNLANAATPGYKRIEVIFTDAYRPDRPDDSSVSEPTTVGKGCKVAGLRVDLTPGELRETGRSLDLAIEGPGLFALRDDAGPVYSRCGRLTTNCQGQLCLQQDGVNCMLDPAITIPQDAIALQVAPDGTIQYATAQADAEECVAGQILLAICLDDSKLAALGGGIFRAAPELVLPTVKPGLRGVGVVRQGMLEQSNVDPDREQANREHWQTMLKWLPSGFLSRTAHDPSLAPR